MTERDSAAVLAGAAVIVTGAGQGLGAAYATAAAAHGAAVVVNDIDRGRAETTASRIRDAGGRVVADGSDVSDWSEAEYLVERCVEEFGAIDGLVNNAGIVHVASPAADTGQAMARVVGTNLLGALFCGTHALRHMLRRGSGSIVNVTSGAALGVPDMAAYSASKGGITALTYSWAASVTDTGVRVNAVAPNAETPAADELRTRYPNLPTGSASPESNAPAVVHLLSADGARHNGRILVTGGAQLRVLPRAEMGVPIRRDDWSPASVADGLRELLDGDTRCPRP